MLYKVVFLIFVTITTLAKAKDNQDDFTLPNFDEDGEFKKYAQLTIINKITARPSKEIVTIGKIFEHGTLKIELIKCWQTKQDIVPENMGLFSISEHKAGEIPEQLVFQGWLFSNKIITTAEHPVYDIILNECSDIQYIPN